MTDICLAPMTADLRGLFARSDAVEGSYEWFRTLIETTLDSHEKAVVAVARDAAGDVRAALPLVGAGRGLRALTAPYTTRYVPALPDPEWARRLGEGAGVFVSGVLRLDALAADDPGIAALLEGLARSGLATARYRHFANWYEAVTDFDAYWSKRPSRLKTTARRKQTHAREAEFRCYREPSELEDAISLYEEIYRHSWKQPEPHPRFMAEMVRALGAIGMVRLGVLSLSGMPSAAQIWLVAGGKATIFKLAHRQDAAESSPGTLLTRWMASLLIGQGDVREIDFGRGDDGYKRDWVGCSRDRIGLVASSWKSAAGLTAIAREIVPTRLSMLRRRIVKQR